jgi:dipeptidyl aminopeptidase/acylaminoacyl peptidase/uncharacterized RDD family membrane protein YckC
VPVQPPAAAGGKRAGEPEARPAPHGLRLIAFLIDLLVVAVVFVLAVVLDVVVGEPVLLYAGAGITLVYYLAVTVWLMDGQTAGKATCGLHVRRIDQAPVPRSLRGVTWSLGRHSVGYVVTDIVGLGTLLALVTPRRRCLHDFAFASEVVLVGDPDDAHTSVARYRAFWEVFAGRYEDLTRAHKWFFTPWKLLTRVMLMVATPLLLAKDALEAGASPPASAVREARRLAPKQEACLWAGTAVATGLVIAGLVPQSDPIRNVNVVTAEETVGRPETSEIYMMKPNGAGLRPLTSNDSADHDPDLFADEKIVFTAERDDNEEIYVLRVDGTGTERLTDDQAADWCPDWSPDGERIAFTSERVGNSEIYIMDADGTNPMRVTRNEADDVCPDWSSDGKRIAFVSTRDGDAEIHVMDADGGGVKQLTDSGGESPRWSPDMSAIAFTSDRDGDDDVYAIGADGRREQRITDHPANDFAPSWAPDGSKILFWSERGLEGGASEVYAMNPDGSGQTKLTSFND